MTSVASRILVYGYGNPGRQDDGLGVMVAGEIENWSRQNGLHGIHTDSNYQLNLEDAAEIVNYDIVIFADASSEDITDFLCEPLLPSASVEFSMHAVSPAFILHLARQVFDHEPEAWLFHIRGYEWEFMGKMTERAEKNFKEACNYLKKFIAAKYGLKDVIL